MILPAENAVPNCGCSLRRPPVHDPGLIRGKAQTGFDPGQIVKSRSPGAVSHRRAGRHEIGATVEILNDDAIRVLETTR